MIRPNWMDYSQGIIIEWRQAMEEGKDVADMEALCELISKHTDAEGYAPIADAVLTRMQNAKLRADYPYEEPSEYDAILCALPEAKGITGTQPAGDPLKDKIEGAWLGRISGCLLGKPMEGMMREPFWALLKATGNFPMQRYVLMSELKQHEARLRPQMEDFWDRGWWADMLDGAAPVDDDTNYTVMYLKLLQTYGREFTSDDILDAWLNWMPMLESSTAERLTYRNAAMGLSVGETALFHNPCREWVGAQIRGDIFGYVNPGNPREAARMAWLDARVSHVKNGIYGEMFIAAMVAAAFVQNDIADIIGAGLSEIPEKCRLAAEVRAVIKDYQSGMPYDAVVERIHRDYDEQKGFDWCQTIPNAMIVAAALLYAEGDFGKSLCMAVHPAFDTDCNGATVGSIVGVMLGASAIPDYWVAPFQRNLKTGISGYQRVTVASLVDETCSLVETP